MAFSPDCISYRRAKAGAAGAQLPAIDLQTLTIRAIPHPECNFPEVGGVILYMMQVQQVHLDKDRISSCCMLRLNIHPSDSYRRPLPPTSPLKVLRPTMKW
jgi:hypothetical protein